MTPIKYGLIRGRFQPFHLGHLNLCREILRFHDVLVVGVVITKPDITEDMISNELGQSIKASIMESFSRNNNPFSFTQIYTLIQGSLLDDGISPKRFIIVPHFPPMIYSEEMEMICMPRKDSSTLYVVGKSPHNSFSAKYYNDKGWRTVFTSHLYTDQNGNPISGTSIRNAIKYGKQLDDLLPPFVVKFIKENLPDIFLHG